MEELEEREPFIEAIGWLTRRTMVATDSVEITHFCPFCASDAGHPENLHRLKEIFDGKGRA